MNVHDFKLFEQNHIPNPMLGVGYILTTCKKIDWGQLRTICNTYLLGYIKVSISSFQERVPKVG